MSFGRMGGLGRVFGRLGASSGVSIVYDPAALAFFARLTTPPTTARKAAYNTVFVSLRSASLLTGKLDLLWLAGADSQATRQNLIQDAYNLTAVASPAFVADRGYTSDGTTSYLDSNFTPSTAGGNFQQNSLSLGAWGRTVGNTGKTCGANTGGTGSAFIRPFNGAGSSDFNSVANAAISDTTAGQGGTGLAAGARAASGTHRQYRNGSLVASPARASTANAAAKLFFCASSDNTNAVNLPSTSQIAAGFAGGNLTDAEMTSLYSIINTYLTQIGAA